QASAEALEPDGWFHTGDIGEIDEDGFVRITGRKKELIVTAGGKNVAPAVLEDRVRAHWLVSQCLVVGDQQPFVAALITIDPESFPTWLAQHDRPADTQLADVVDDPELRAEIQLAVDEANKAVSHAESIRKFAILPDDWTEAGGQLTPSLKLKRNVVHKEAAREIEALYGAVRTG
ncbi:MAG TPA: long-chain fatty acid--CoA ligase, partial [Jatrophihabitans sp.]|nr:long-chain fatty acid--CoA ligase [Jatrophihabitans sp.]